MTSSETNTLKMPVEVPAGRQRKAQSLWVVFGCLLIGLAIGWALKAVFTAPQDVQSELQDVTFESYQGTLEDSLQLNASVSWVPVPAGVNRSTGTVTEVNVSSGEQVKTGAALYSVDEQPVHVAQGAIPAYRTLQEGIKGSDVRQLSAMLTELGFYSNPKQSTFDRTVVQAVNAWQRSSGQAVTGAVELGHLVFLPELPAGVVLDEVLTVGQILNGGENALATINSDPVFNVELVPGQLSRVTTGTPVVITSPRGNLWHATVGEIAQTDSGTYSAVLVAQSGETICAQQCSELSAGNEQTLPSQVIVIPKIDGTIVPAGAVQSGTNNSSFVVTVAGASVDVEILGVAQGKAVLAGLEPGTQVVVPSGTLSPESES